jgi:4-hydroxy-2-oxoheptanedioate aldolase
MQSFPQPPFSQLLHADRAQYGIWVASASAYCAEICAGSGLDWLLIDGEHTPNDVPSILAQLQAVSGYPICPLVRPPVGDPVLLKQYLDIGATNLLVPMVESRKQAEMLARAVRYPPTGTRGVASTFSRAAQWGRRADYFERIDAEVTLVVQIETVAALARLEEIATVEGVDALFVGPADLAASMGHLGQQSHPEVVAAVEHAIARAVGAGVPIGVNAFAPSMARRYVEAGCRFVGVGADITMIVEGGANLAATYLPTD